MANETICFLRNDLDKEKKENERLQDLMKDCEGFTPRVHVCFQLLLHVPSFSLRIGDGSAGVRTAADAAGRTDEDADADAV